MARPDPEHDGVIIELIRYGATVRVSALDPRTLVEVTLQGPASAGEAALTRAVLRKLDYVLARRHARALARDRSLL